jgi:type IV pilus assembly protein PilB
MRLRRSNETDAVEADSPAQPPLRRPRTRDHAAHAWPSDSPTPPAGLRQGTTGHERLGTVLVGRGLVTHDQLAAALTGQRSTGERLGTLLVGLGVLSDRDLVAALAQQVGLPLADLRHDAPSPEAARLLPEPVARSLGAIPLSSRGDALVVAIADPATQDDVRQALGRPAQLVLATPAEVSRAIDNTYRALVDVDRHVAAFTATEQGRRHGQQLADAEAGDDDAPVVRIVTMLLTQALRDRASDVHVEPQDSRVRVRFRIDGALHDVLTLPVDMSSALASRIKIMAGMNIVERRRPQDGQIATTIDGRAIDIRVATTGTIWGEKVVLRILDKSRPLYRLQDLGMPTATHEAYSRMIRSPYGMVICAGPTGSGKTTTLYASMSEVNGPEHNITTIEDPVEYVFPSINQIQINEAAGITFATGLRSILRQDPDMILVGEMRDVETARIAVQSAMTGHFVLSSLHATDSVSALYRFLDMGIEAFLVASSVIGIVGQRLVRRMCTYCRVPHQPGADELAFFRSSGGSPKQDFWIGEGCNFCSGTGYSDRIGVYELLSVTEQMRELLVQPHPSHDDMRRLAVQQGMNPLRAEGVRLVEDDVTTIAEIVRSIYTL